MSTTEAKRSLAAARADAERFRALFAGTFEQWVIAGSVRREKPEVGDIEHVVIPAFGDVIVPGSMFVDRGNLLWDRLNSFVGGTVKKHVYGDAGFRWGEKYRGVDYRGFTHEIFCADAENFGAILAIRTGPADFSRHLVTVMRDHGYRQEDGYVIDREGRRVAAPDEKAYFRICGMPYLEPEKRR